MFYQVSYTQPTLKIKRVEDYKARVKEIVFWQIKDTLSLKWTAFTSLFEIRSLEDFFLAAFMFLFSLLALPFAIVYLALCVVELALDSLLLPLYLIPVVRILPTVVCVAVWATSFAVGIFGGVALEKLD